MRRQVFAVSLVALVLGACGDTALGVAQSAMSAPRPPPRRIQRMVRPGDGDTVSPNNPLGTVDYYGGAIIANVHPYAVFWGASVDATTQANMGSFLNTVVQSPYWDWMAEFSTTVIVDAGTGAGSAGTNQTFGRGVYQGAITLTPFNTSTTLTSAAVEQELSAQVNAGHLPAPDDNSLFIVFFPATIVIDDGPGLQSCIDYCAYHGSYLNDGGQDVAYAVIMDQTPSSACIGGCGTDSVPFNILTSVTSHEMVEASTDLNVLFANGLDAGPPLAWYDIVDNAESADLCNHINGAIAGAGDGGVNDGGFFVVQQIYSHVTKSCKTVAPPKYALTLPALVDAGAVTNVAVTAKYAGTPAVHYSGTATVTSSDPLAMLPAPVAVVDGGGAFSITLKTAGLQSVTLTDSAGGSGSGATTVVATGVAALVADGIPATAQQGVANTFGVTALDVFGNAATTYSGTANVTSSDLSATFPAQVTFVGGHAAGSVTFQTLGSQLLTFTDSVHPLLTVTASATVVVFDAGLDGGDPDAGTSAPEDAGVVTPPEHDAGTANPPPQKSGCAVGGDFSTTTVLSALLLALGLRALFLTRGRKALR